MVFLLLAAVTAAFQLSVLEAVTFRFDEVAWTKSTWKDFKINQERKHWRVTDDPLLISHLNQLKEDGYEYISAVGPAGRVDDEDDIKDVPISKEWNEAGIDGWMVDTDGGMTSERALLDPVCKSIVENAWKLIENNVHDKVAITVEQIRWQMLDICADVQDDVLSQYTLTMEEQASSTKIGVEHRLRPRKKGQPQTEMEINAVRLACERLVKAHELNFISILKNGLLQYEAAVNKILTRKKRNTESQRRQHDETELSNEKGNVDDEGKEEGKEESVCEDLHPECEKWADEGECQRNPNYMIGNAKVEGHCRLSCGICESSEDNERYIHFLIIFWFPL